MDKITGGFRRIGTLENLRTYTKGEKWVLVDSSVFGEKTWLHFITQQGHAVTVVVETDKRAVVEWRTGW